MTQPAQIRNLLTAAAQRQREQREAMAKTSDDIAQERLNALRDVEAEKPQQS